MFRTLTGRLALTTMLSLPTMALGSTMAYASMQAQTTDMRGGIVALAGFAMLLFGLIWSGRED